jgi:hypothetical protein
MAKPFREYMAETGQQSTLDDLERNFKFGQAEGQYNSQGWYGSGTGSPGYEDRQRRESELQRSRQLQEQAVSTLQAQQPKIGEIYQGKQQYLQSQIDPTKARYDALLADLKGQQQTETERQTLATSRELAKRGVASTSGLGEQEMVNALNPINRTYSGLFQKTGLEQESSIKNIQDAISLLAGDQSQSEISLAQAISQAQSGAGAQALQSYQTQAQLDQQAAQNRINQMMAEQSGKQSDIENQIKMAQLSLAQQSSPYELAILKAQANKANQTGSGNGTIDLQSLLDEYMRGLG